jgi:hypothetical protein
LNFGKPDLDLIEPTGIGRGVMDPYGWMGLEELENILGFVCAQVVGHDMNLSTLRLAGDDLAEKVDKLGAGFTASLIKSFPGLCRFKRSSHRTLLIFIKGLRRRSMRSAKIFADG